MAELTTIIPIAGGKGGVGKTFVTANLAVALAQRGYRTIAVDLDLGNSNLHSLLGLENRYAGVGEYLKGTVKCSPDELIVETGVPNLGFIPGDSRVPFMANIKYHEKSRLIKFLKALPARYVLLDLSAGTAFNTLDFFRTGTSGIVVTTPEHSSLMSALVFVKNLVLRAFDESLRRIPSVQTILSEMYKQSVNDPVFTVERFRNELATVDQEVAEKVDAICRRIRPRFVYNMVDGLEDTGIFANIATTCEDVLSIECEQFGFIPYDPEVRHFMKEPRIFLLESPGSTTTQTIDRLSRRVIELWDTRVEGSAELLANYALEVFPEPHAGRAGQLGGNA
jgi:flagellar biosynthesis protein FlhG